MSKEKKQLIHAIGKALEKRQHLIKKVENRISGISFPLNFATIIIEITKNEDGFKAKIERIL